ncbi:MAG: DUF1836 domain-containing protein [Lachnospira sp.]|nr:DUF1836 domain-containing protein [Lachnospira sp.]
MSVLKKLSKINYIKPGDVPNINLYMDQVTTFMDEHLSDCKRHEDDKILTKTMINNYTKNDLLPPPEKKKYSKDHLYLLAFIYYFKNILCISDIQKLLNPLTENFFATDSSSKSDLDAIYEDVYEMCKSQIGSLSKDVISKAKLADTSVSDMEDSESKNFLNMFYLVSMLSFDVYLKKNLIETLIDDYNAKHAPAEPDKPKKDKSKKDKK